MIDLSNWTHLWQQIAAHGDPEITYQKLIAAYMEPHRRYHNLTHIRDCLQQLSEIDEEQRRKDLLALVLWFHDVVFKPTSPRNEENSAKWAARVLREANVSEYIIEQVIHLILMTKHPSKPSTRIEKILVDIDLSILGRSKAVFERYENAIREEFEWVPDWIYQNNRMRFLQGLLNHKSVYYTRHFQMLYEEQARINLKTAIARLSEPE